MRPLPIAMLIANLEPTGTHRVMMDIIENINHRLFRISVAYKSNSVGRNNELLKELNHYGIDTVPLRGNHLYSILGVSDLFRHLRRNSIRIVHCWDALGLTARLLSLITRFKVVESYCNPIHSKGSPLFYGVNRLSSLLMDGLIFCTESVYKDYCRKKVISLKRKHIALIPDCINCSKLGNVSVDPDGVRQKLGISVGEKILTNIGVFNEQKNQIELIRTVNIIRQSQAHIRLILIGWGPNECLLRNEVKTLGLEKNVLFLGKLPPAEVPEILSITDILVHCSRWEGFGLVIGEAMALAKPVVCTRTSGSEFLVDDGITGILVPHKNPSAMTHAVLHLLENPHKMKKMGEQGRRRVARLFSPQQFARAHEKFYRRVIYR